MSKSNCGNIGNNTDEMDNNKEKGKLMTRLIVLTIIMMVATTLSAQINYQRQYDYVCEPETLRSSFPSDTLLTDACHDIEWVFPPLYPPLDPGEMGYYDAPAVRLPNPTDREKHGLRGAVRSVTDTICHNVTMTSLGPIRHGYSVYQLIFDTTGRQVEDFLYNSGDNKPFRHGLHAYDTCGFPVLNSLIDENGDTMFVCRWRNFHDAVGNLLLSVMTDGEGMDTTWYRYQFTTDSALRETYEKNQLVYRDVYHSTPQGLRLTLALSHPANGRLTTIQKYTYGERLERYVIYGLYTSEVGEHRYTYSEQGDKVREEFWRLDGKRMESADTYSYRYDAHGNWIERLETRLDNGKTHYTLTKRIIEYY